MSRHQSVLAAIFEKRANIAWPDIEAMLLHFGAEITGGRGSRVRIALNGVRVVFHRGAVASMRRFLVEAGIGVKAKS